MKDEVLPDMHESRKIAAFHNKTGEILYTYSFDTQLNRDPSEIIPFHPGGITNKKGELIDDKDIDFTPLDIPEEYDPDGESLYVNTSTKKIEMRAG